ncbi:stage II sporulation protein M [Psychrobacillus sp. FSL H8-0484]|uniref:stage II sporulation protein M n=1 Tax=Psychrobacillus sp. FSL H8-0484 TaxID=2921390 RepID=UPI0030F5F8A2
MEEVATIPKIVNKNIFKRAVFFFIIAATITILATIITYMINPDLKGVMESLGDKSSNQFRESTGIKKVWAYVVNNGFVVPLQMFVLTLIPVQFLYLINIISTAFLPGILFGVVLQVDSRKGIEIITSTIPHYFVEVFAFCLFAAVLFELNRAVRIKIRNLFKKDKEGISLVGKISETIKIYVVLILPLIILAAFLETYIADIIFSLFQ